LRPLAVAAVVFGAAMVWMMRPAAAAPCVPPQSAAMLTGPVYDAIRTECEWIDAVGHSDAAKAAPLLAATASQVDANGMTRSRDAILKAVASGDFAGATMDVRETSVPFSAGSTNVVVSTWTIGGKKQRVTDVFFCDVSRTCVYRLVSEQLTPIKP